MKKSDAVGDNMLSPDPGEIASLISTCYHRIFPHLVQTRLIYDDHSHLWLKCENEQQTGSFKWRGALAKLSKFKPGQSIVTASTGNHGLAVTAAAELYSLKAKVFIPSTAAKKKMERLHQAGADVILVDGDSLDAELTGKEFASKNNLPWVSPYNDDDVIAGQGTIGYEIDGELPNIDRIYITIGGGGLVSGIASWMKQHQPNVEIIGCQPQHSPEMYQSILAGHVVTVPYAQPTLSDGSAGPLEEDSITFSLCQKLVDHYILISEAEIKSAIRYLFDRHQLVVEGAGGVAMAAALKDRIDKNLTSVVILCGGNIDPSVHHQICIE
jgi:threonine dehydratase